MPYAPWQIKNLILMEISHETIPEDEWNNPDSTNTDIPIINAQYNLAVPIALTYYKWSFLQKFAKLDLVDNTDNNTRYQKKATLPADIVGHLYAYANDKRSFVYANFEVIGPTLYAQNTPLWIQYTAQIPEEEWPDYFVDWFKTFVAIRVNSYLNGDVQREAILTQKEPMLCRTAKNIDSKFNPNESVVWNPFIASRGQFGGGNIS